MSERVTEENNVSSDASGRRSIAWGPLLIMMVGALLFSLGVGRFVSRHHFTLTDAIYCGLALAPAGLLLLIFSYVFHHARIVAILLVGAAGLLAWSSPIFDVALGLALMAAMGGPMMNEWKDEKRLCEAKTVAAGENLEQK
jgi:asparagine N-glycosylation enzyme membrane subunit Stt3